jgi:hypothetical protein
VTLSRTQDYGQKRTLLFLAFVVHRLCASIIITVLNVLRKSKILEPDVQRDFQGKERDRPLISCYKSNENPYTEANREDKWRRES